jgi:ankyrin repeat protein
LDKQADANLRNEWRQTPLHYTTQNKTSAVAELLLSRAADVSATDNKGRTPLHRCKSKPVAEVLVARGADVNAKDSSGYTPLHWAATPRETVDGPTIEYLLEQGADPTARNNEGLTPCELAEKNGQKSLIHVLDARKE